MKSFLEWRMIEAKTLSLKKKRNSVTHSDIDRWLKSVNDLAQDLKDLQAAKEKSKNKMTQIGQKNNLDKKPDEKSEIKPDEKSEKEPEIKPEVKSVKIKPEVKNKPEMDLVLKKPKRVIKSSNAEDRQDVKQIIKRKPKSKINDVEE